MGSLLVHPISKYRFRHLRGSIIRKLTATERNAKRDVLTFNLTHSLFQEALEVLRTTPNNVVLTVCRPPGDVFCAQGPSEPPPPPPPPPRRDPAHSVSCHSQHVLPLPPLQTDGPCGVSARHSTTGLFNSSVHSRRRRKSDDQHLLNCNDKFPSQCTSSPWGL